MEPSEESVRQRLIDRLLELGYPKSSILLEVSFATSKAAKAKKLILPLKTQTQISFWRYLK
ncbi:hypothetical protein [Pseudomonas paralactis]|uniref:hypothetical protein n=1 Tax=Pseudomonas paralactis TaxID=1615673 RepID=UPI0012F75ABD|nr:hypothetical protein [Pseudomonas paralactis]